MRALIAGRYELEREIGRGGMGAVWLARDVVLDRAVALKRVGMMPGADSADLERVRREARVSAMLNHRHVVAVYDLVDEGDDHWLVMEHVPSSNLGDVIRSRGSLSADDTARLVGQAASAVAEAHRVGIVHRDIKPGNMLVTTDGQVKLGDFGIARTGSDPSLTQTGLVTGSPAYLAPEVATGQAATPASDVWSLGATVFHAVTGGPPFDTTDNLIGALYRIVHEEPPRTDRAGWLEPLLRSTMHRDPAGRWTATQVADFLLRGPGHPHPPVPVLERPAPVAPPARVAPPASVAPVGQAGREEPPPAGSTAVLAPSSGHRAPRRRGLWPALLVLVLVLAVGGVAAWALTRDDPSPSGSAGDDSSETAPDSSTDPSSESPTDEPTAEGMTDFITTYLDTVTSDPATTWRMLTPEFQAQSKNYTNYTGFWGTIAVATVSDVVADPETLEVSYHVEYTLKNGRTTGDDVRLRLVHEDGDYLIAEEF